ncbi:MAG: MazG nucleotide pyrophosphohydrolase domain-containing protein [Desulfurococcaceae archaeon]|uniref:Nucleotide pyrophosphohydrolase n=1 Tax=Staphylothermus marinus TaxID=2280 RepID=A0A7C4H8R3_STAMA
MNISEAQEIIKKKYFDRDSARGLYATFTWFIEEVGELADSIIKMNRNNIEEELADVFAWLLSIANLLNIDLSEVFKKKYVS